MENNENFVAEQAAENVEQTTEQTQKLYTEEEFHAKVNEATGKRVARIEKKMERKYGNLISTLEAGTGKKGVEELDETYRDFFTSRGVKIPPRQGEHSEKDDEYLGEKYAKDIISEGEEEAEDEFARLEAKGAKMTKREQHTFRFLAEHLQDAKNYSDLAKLGVTKEEYNSKEYQEFRQQFAPNVPEEKRYQMYQQTKPKKEHKTMGSMKSNTPPDNGVKDFYSFEEAKKFTKADFDKNPALFKKVQESMTKW